MSQICCTRCTKIWYIAYSQTSLQMWIEWGILVFNELSYVSSCNGLNSCCIALFTNGHHKWLKFTRKCALDVCLKCLYTITYLKCLKKATKFTGAIFIVKHSVPKNINFQPYSTITIQSVVVLFHMNMNYAMLRQTQSQNTHLNIKQYPEALFTSFTVEWSRICDCCLFIWMNGTGKRIDAITFIYT